MLPVMVWIHGGGFIHGSGSRFLYGPDFLVAEGVIVVTINYRLGALGKKTVSVYILKTNIRLGKHTLDADKWSWVAG